MTPVQDDSLLQMARDRLTDLWRWAGLIIVLTVLGASLAFVANRLSPDIYSAKSTFFLDFSRQAALTNLPAENLEPSVNVLNTELAILSSRTFLESVVVDMGLEDDPEFNGYLELDDDFPVPEADEVRRSVVSALSRSIRVKLVPDSYVFEVTVESESSEKAAEIANRVVDKFITGRDERRSTASGSATEWLEERVSDLRERTIESERELNASRLLAPGNDGNALSTVLEQIALARERLSRVEGRLSDLDALSGEIESHLSTENYTEAAQAIVDSGEATGSTADLRRALGGGSEDLPEVVADSKEGIDAARAELSAEAGRFRDRLEDLEAQYADQSSAIVDISNLELTVQANKASYAAMLENMRGRFNGQDSNALWPDAHVISRAVPPEFPAGPGLDVVLVLGTMGGFILGSSAALLLSAIFPVIGSPRETETTAGVRTISTIGAIDGPVAPLLADAREPGSKLNRKLLATHTALLALRDGSDQVVALVTPAEGDRTAVPYLVGQAFALTGSKVLVIEVDLGTSPLLPDAPMGPSLAALRHDRAQPQPAIRHHDESGIDILRSRSDRDMTLSAKRTIDRPIEGKTGLPSYDVILLATNAAGAEMSLYAAGDSVDLVLIEAHRHVTRRVALRRTVETLRAAGARRLGVLLRD